MTESKVSTKYAICLGVISSLIASAIWPFVSGFWAACLNYVVNIFVSISDRYDRSVYMEVGEIVSGVNTTSGEAYIVGSLMLPIIVMILLLVAEPRILPEKSKSLLIAVFGMSIFTYVLINFGAAKANYSVDLAAKLNSSLFIIAPYISEQDFRMLKSRACGIKNKKDFDVLAKELTSIANKNKVEIRKLEG